MTRTVFSPPLSPTLTPRRNKVQSCILMYVSFHSLPLPHFFFSKSMISCPVTLKCKRIVSVRELARAQGFPDWFVFETHRGNVVTVKFFSIPVNIFCVYPWIDSQTNWECSPIAAGACVRERV